MTTGRWTCVSLLAVLLCVSARPAEAATIYVPDGGDLQAALNTAQPGDTILLAQGAEFVGNFVLPAKIGDGWITLRSSTPDAVLPVPGVRILPEYAPLLARLRSPTIDTAALRTAPGAHHWDIRFLEFAANPMGSGDLIQLGDGSAAQNSLDKVPHHLVLRHVYVHGDPNVGQKRCIALNAGETTIADSYVADCKSATQDSQAIAGWNGPGPYTIENNYLEGAGENVMFGGADPSIPDLVPSNILFRRNLVSRPMAWLDPIIPTPQGVTADLESGGSLPPGTYAYRVVARRPVGAGAAAMGQSTASVAVTATATSDAGSAVRVRWDPVPDATEYRVYGRAVGTQTIYWRVTTTEFLDTGAAGTSGAVPTGAGTSWAVKNLFELKSASKVTVEDNIFENNWVDAQVGYSIVLTPRNSSGGCSWCVVEHVLFQYNIVRNAGGGFNITGYDDSGRVTKQTNNIDISNNLFLLNTALGNGWFMLIGNEPRDVRVHHNTIVSSGTAVVTAHGGSCASPRQIHGFEYVGNAARFGLYGINSSCGTGNPTIAAYFPDGLFMWNCLAGAPASRYPAPPAFIPCAPFEAQFVDFTNGDYTVAEGSPLKRAALCPYPYPGEQIDPPPVPCDIGVVDFAGLIAKVGVVPNPVPPTLPTRPTAKINVACTYLDCAFADESVEGTGGAIVERLWTFGDGSFGTDASGTHSFAAKGTYTITLLVKDGIGLEDSERTTVSVRPPNVKPTAAFDSACVDLTCTFTDRSTDSDGNVAAWAWSFGAGGSVEQSPIFPFAAPGTYNVSLTVTDNEGATSTTIVAVEVRALIHAALVSSTTGGGKGNWNVTAVLGIHGSDERAIAGATIQATWTGKVSKTLSCVTGDDGRCTFSTGTLGGSYGWVTLTVLSVSAPLSNYQSSVNHDPAGTPSGTSWTFKKP